MKQMIAFLKKEVVLTISGILATCSCFLVHPDSAYAGYIDWLTILILFCLMAVMSGLKDIGLFQYTGETLLKKINSERGVVCVLVIAFMMRPKDASVAYASEVVKRGDIETYYSFSGNVVANNR